MDFGAGKRPWKRLHTQAPHIIIYTCARIGSTEELAQHVERFEFREVGDVKAVVVVDVAQQAVALLSREFEDVHRGKLHAHEQGEQGRIFGSKVVAVERLLVGEATVEHVEIAALSEVTQVGVESQEARQAEQKDDVEVGEAPHTRVEPLYGAYQVFKKQLAVVLLAEGVVEKFRDKHGDGRFVGVGGNVDHLLPHAHRLKARQCSPSVVPFRFKNRERLQKTRLDQCML